MRREGGIMEADVTFGQWLRRRRRTLDLTQNELAQQVGCAVVTIRKIEADERRPSKQLATLMAGCLDVASEEQASFIAFARAEPYLKAVAPLAVPAEPAPRFPPSTPTSAITLPPFLEEDTKPEPVPTVFVARARELSELEATLDTAQIGAGQILFVIGGAGRGKTMLVQEFARRAQATHADLVVVTGYCNAHTGIGDPYLPFREALTMLTGNVEAKWAGGLISQQHARRLWESMSITLPALVKHAPDLIGSFVSGEALQARAATIAPDDAPWFKQLATLRGDEHSARLDQKRIFAQYTPCSRRFPPNSHFCSSLKTYTGSTPPRAVYSFT
jgi:transcriptional regulator with XRE-family HTH domain